MSADKKPVEYKLGSYRDEDGIKVTMITRNEEVYLPYLWEQTVARLMDGINPKSWEALQLLKEKYPKKLEGVIARLTANYSVSGIKEFEQSMMIGFKKLGMWNGKP